MSRDSYWLRTRWRFTRPHKRRFDDRFLKIGDGAESNQNRGGVKWIPGPEGAKLIFAKTTPCTVDMPLKSLDFLNHDNDGSQPVRSGALSYPPSPGEGKITASWRRVAAGVM